MKNYNKALKLLRKSGLTDCNDCCYLLAQKKMNPAAAGNWEAAGALCDYLSEVK